MNAKFFLWHSLKARLTLFAVTIFVASVWLGAFYAIRMLRGDMQHLLGEQQFSAVSFIAARVDEVMDDRLRGLEKIAQQITPALLGNPAALQALVEQRPILLDMFSTGVFVTGIDGTAIADVPISAGRRGVNFMERDYVVAALMEGKSSFGRPVMGKVLRMPVVGMAAPIRDTRGKVIGALVGAINLGEPNFLEKSTNGSQGLGGGYRLLVARQSRLIVTASEKSRVMEPVPSPGVIPAIDRFMQGYEGSAVYVNPLGVEVLSSSKGIPAADWIMVNSLPTEVAFAPLRDLQQRILFATILFTLLGGSLVWWITSWMLRRQFSPMQTAIKALGAQSGANPTLEPLPITSQDEFGELIGGFNCMLAILRQREDALLESEERFRQFMNTLPAAVFIKDEDSTTLYANRYMEEVLGARDWLGKSARDVFPPEVAEKMNADDRCALETGYVVTEEQVQGTDGQLRLYQTHKFSIPRPGRHPLLGGIALDITERKRAESEILRSNAALEQFSYAISHDLRQPLRMISSYLQLLDQGISGKIDSEQREYFNFAIDGAKRMDTMMLGLLEYSRVGRGGEPPAWVESRTMLEEALLFLQPAIAEAQANVRIAGEWPRVLVSRDEMLRLMQNLIGNALKFRVKGHTPEIAVTSATVGSEWHMSVSDNGVGILPEQIDRLFQVFQRLQSRADYEGTGIGLALCRKIAEHHHGRIWAESAGEGRGSTFQFELPLVGSAGETRAIPASS